MCAYALGSVAPAGAASLVLYPAPIMTPPAVTFSTKAENPGLANLLLLEQGVVIATDDWAYVHSPNDAGKMNPLTGLPIVRTVFQEVLVAVSLNIMLRNPHHKKLLNFTSVAFPILERSIIGSMYKPWKTFKI